MTVAGSTTVAGNIIPSSDSATDIGTNSVRFANIYADTLYGDGSNLTGIAADKIFEGNTEVETVDTGSDGHVKITTEGNERLRIDSSGHVLIGSTSNNTDDVGDSALQVHTLDDLHPAIRVNSASNNGYTMFGDAYQAGESQVNIGISHSSSSLVLSQGCKVNISTDDAYVSSQDSYSTRPNVLRLDSDGSLSFHNTSSASTTPTDNAVSLTERFRILSNGNISVGSNGAAAEKFQVNGGNIAIVGGAGYKIDTHPLLVTASFTDISGGSYAARL